ncbi:zinc finger BED domain-containing protein 1-like [Rhizophagus clarus]|uniref:Zinc finger BED domain-containing protein 1-like n=1 Tax=Rhizophagus clarus TaxID=94130 RepID=A0A8H3QN58_9GLOM|nr:zinc finger BED domain-containing protein 1-like [Rhizophagus clarus]
MFKNPKLKTLDPNYILPSGKYIEQLTITKAYNYSKRDLTLFKDTIKCSITTDYGPLEIVKVILELQECQYLEYPHTSKNITQILLNLISEWSLEKKLVCIVTNNGSNMVTAPKLLPNTFQFLV